MKITNLSSKSSKQQSFESENVIAIEQGITKRLLEKYKPKSLYNKGAVSDRIDQERVA